MTDKKLEPIVEYYEDGTIKQAYSTDENGNQQGPYEEYYDNGQLKEKCTYKDGERFNPEEAKKARKGLSARLEQMSKKIPATEERQAAKNSEVAKFRAQFLDKKDGR